MTANILKNNAARAAHQEKLRPASVRAEAEYRRKRFADWTSQIRARVQFWFRGTDEKEALLEVLTKLEEFEGAAMRAVNAQEEKNK